MPNPYRRTLDKLLTERALAVRQVKDELAALQDAQEQVQAAQEALALVQVVAEQAQSQAHAQLAGVVSRSLEAVFDDPYEFVIQFDKKRNRTEARLTFTRKGQSLDDPLAEAGGGCIDIAALALRIACLLLERPAKRRVLIADEPLKAIHGDDNRKRAAALLVSLADELDVQIIMATGLEWLHVGKVIHLGE